MTSEIIFWLSLLLIFYTYFGYPFVLVFLTRIKKSTHLVVNNGDYYPAVTILIPVHNEVAIIESKINNCKQIIYPENKLEILFVSDGSTDGTNAIIKKNTTSKIKLEILPERSGKALALNKGLSITESEIVVFSDASIILEADAIKNIVQPFKNPLVGCVSGEDIIKDSGGEGVYGRYELWLRKQESKLFSIVGASGSFYAQRRELVKDFKEGIAPDFLSVLETVKKGYRAISEPNAIGYMKSLENTVDEFKRKVRTLIRGMSAFFFDMSILNPFKYFWFSVELISHKLFRWLVPFFLLINIVSNIFLLKEIFYFYVLIINILFYLLAILAHQKILKLDRTIIGKIPLYFSAVNSAIFIAWIKYLSGVRQELWNPTKRNQN
jgi:cellulose synthase/poly-beta-1,6-N-acetylglucosamine synthase-like glycosyltransferase